MNQGRIWCVVHPTVGLPLLLGSVALTSLIVHASVMEHTSWMSNYWQGAARLKTADNAGTPALAAAEPGFAVTIAPAAAIPGRTETSFLVTVSRTAAAPVIDAAAEAPDPGRTIAVATATP